MAFKRLTERIAEFDNDIMVEDYLEKIARECLGIETLETRSSDSLDFHEVSVWGLNKALMSAYNLGLYDASREKPNG